LDPTDPLLAGRKIQQLQSALKEVEQFHQIDSNQRCALLAAIQVIAIFNIKPSRLSTMLKPKPLSITSPTNLTSFAASKITWQKPASF
jgi:hypothetical protein